MSGLTFESMNDWRQKAKEILQEYADICSCRITVINPVDYYNFNDKKHQSEAEVEDFDLAHAITSNIIIVNLSGLSTSDGTKIELHDCNYHRRIPVIAFGKSEEYEKLHPWTKRDITRVECDIYSVCKYIRDFYMT